ncbi:hypothetical protein [Mariniplasma anaerobium]|uniref:Uncharacterized protein n=1 Tax=Mariniplasma anaerobium TaxID=2735436 RepID=A0A7U9XV87_9MOLU|nr:hypothetical protein [Mariniplasma anaerobium]BCR36676.1 hypothetical protein MPAN_015690 [Mariniplasma anaerobium]
MVNKMIIITDKKLFLFNLLEANYPYNKVLSLYRCLNENHKLEDSIKRCLNYSPDSSQVYADVLKAKKNRYLTIKALMIFGIHELIIDKIKERFPKIQDITHNYFIIEKELELTKDIFEKITYFLRVKTNYFEIQQLSTEMISDIDKDILYYIYKNQPVNLISIQQYLYKEVKLELSEDLLLSINRLEAKKLIMVTSEGILMYLPRFNEIFEQISDDDEIFMNKIIDNKIHGRKIYIYEKMRFNDISATLMICRNEKKYERLLNMFQFNKEQKSCLFPQKDLLAYIELKYHLKPLKTCSDYIIEHELLASDLSKKLLSSEGKIVFNNKIIDDDVSVLIEEFVKSENLIRINDLIYDKFLFFLKKLNVNLKLKAISKIEFFKECSKINGIFMVSDDELLVVNEEKLDSSFLNFLDTALNLFEYPQTSKKLFNSNKVIMKKYEIQNFKELFVVMKHFFKEKYYSKLIFGNNDLIELNDLKLIDYIIQKFEEFEPISKVKLVESLFVETCVDKDILRKIVNDRLNKYNNGEILEVIHERLEENVVNLIKIEFDGYFSQIDLLRKRLKSNLKNDYLDIMFHVQNLKAMNLRREKTLLVEVNYSSFEEAFITWLKAMPKVIDESMIESKIAINSYMFRKMIQKCYIIKSRGFSYYNMTKIFGVLNIQHFRDEIIVQIPEDKIFTGIDILNDDKYKEVFDNFPELDIRNQDIQLLENIIKSSTNIYSYLGDGTAMKKGSLTKTDIVYSEIKNANQIDRLDLEASLKKKYGISNFNSYILRELIDEYGVYQDTQGSFYVDKKTFDKQLEEYLNGTN